MNRVNAALIHSLLRVWSLLPAAVLNLAFAVSLLGFLAMHLSLVFANTTTIEVSCLLSMGLPACSQRFCGLLLGCFAGWVYQYVAFS